MHDHTEHEEDSEHFLRFSLGDVPDLQPCSVFLFLLSLFLLKKPRSLKLSMIVRNAGKFPLGWFRLRKAEISSVILVVIF